MGIPPLSRQLSTARKGSGCTMGRVGSVSILLLVVSSVIVPPATSAPIVAVTGGVALASLPLQALVVGKLLFLKKLLLEGVLLDKILRKSSSSSGAQGYNARNS